MDIWITGIGSICSAGAGSNVLYEASLKSSINIRTIKVRSGKVKSDIPVCSVADNAVDIAKLKGGSKLARTSQLAFVAANEAWIQS